jgi:hypothetical protein
MMLLILQQMGRLRKLGGFPGLEDFSPKWRERCLRRIPRAGKNTG